MTERADAVFCEVEKIDIPNEEGALVPSLRLTCGLCGHCTESYGQRGRSLRRCLVAMREECPEDRKNYYTTHTTIDE